MATKTISITEDAYHRLAHLKRAGESFSQVIQRLTGRVDLMRFAGSIPATLADELHGVSSAFRRRFEEDAGRRDR